MVKMKDKLEGEGRMSARISRGRQENSDKVLGLAYAWQHSRR
jgi:hypothetical protein